MLRKYINIQTKKIFYNVIFYLTIILHLFIIFKFYYYIVILKWFNNILIYN